MEDRVALIVSLIFLLLPFGLFFRESEYVEFLEKSWVSKEHRPLDWRRDMPPLTILSCVVMLATVALGTATLALFSGHIALEVFLCLVVSYLNYKCGGEFVQALIRSRQVKARGPK